MTQAPLSKSARGLQRWQVVLLGLLVAGSVQAQWHRQEQAVMGTVVSVELWHRDAQAAQTAIDAVLSEMRRIDAAMSTYKTGSELSRLNAAAAERAVPVSAELYQLLQRALAFSPQTAGAFDITYASAGYLYDYRRQRRPDPGQLAAVLPAIDYRHVQLNAAQRSVRFLQPKVRIDLGGIAKGYAVDRSIELLRRRGIRQAYVTAGGDSRILGDRHGQPWMTGIRHPRKKGVIAVIPLSDTAISTSGDYERFFVADGQTYHHILDPKTGRSAHGLLSATVLGPDATTTDALSTSVFVLGPQRGLALVESLPGVEAILVTGTGKLVFSSGLDQFQSAAP